MISDSELARELFTGTDKVVGELVKSGVVTTTIEATAVSDSVDGYVLVDMGGDTVTQDVPADQNADTSEDMASSETTVASDENMSPCINMESADAEYWTQVSEGLTITPVDDGWARVAYDNTEGESAATLDAWQNPLDAIEDGATYTLLVEIRPVLPEDEGSESEDTPESHDPDEIPDEYEDGYGADDAEPEEGSDTDGDSTAEVTSSITPTTATSQLGASTSQRMDAGETWLTLTGQTGDTLLGTQFTVDAGKVMETDVRMSLYFGEYTGEYMPYGLLEGGAWQLVPTSSAVKAGDTVTVSLVGGSMVDSRAVGAGDRTDQKAELARTAAEQSHIAAEEAKGVASAAEDAANEASSLATDASSAAEGAQATADAAASVAADAQAQTQATRNHFWHDASGSHVGTVAGSSHEAGAGYNMTLGASDSAAGILLDHGANTLASFTQSALDFYASGNVVASYSKAGVGLFAQDDNDVTQQVAGFTPSAVTFFDGEGNADENVVATFGKAGALIGSAGGEQVSISGGAIALMSEGEVVAFVQGGLFSGAMVEVTQALALGGFNWIPRSNGNTAFKWVG